MDVTTSLTWILLMAFMIGKVEGLGNERRMNTTKLVHQVTSPGYPGPYPPNADKEWNFTMDHGQWTVMFKHFDLEKSPGCKKDYVYIYDGVDPQTLVKRLCDKFENLPNFKSKHSSILIVFHSDSTTQSKGFRLDVVHIPSEDYYHELMLSRHAEAAKVTLYRGEKEPPIMFWTLTISLAILSAVLLALAVYLIVNLKRKKTQSRDTILDIKPQRVSLGPTFPSGRRYTRQLSADSDILPLSPVSDKPEVHSPNYHHQETSAFNSYI